MIDPCSNTNIYSRDKLSHISISKLKATDLDEFLKLSKLEFSNEVNSGQSDSKNSYVESLLTNPDHISWKHLNSPFGASTFLRLVVANNTVGRILLQPRPLYTTSQKFNVACDMDMLVSREFRSPPSNFINLIKASDGISEFDFVYHTANEITHKLYGRLLGFPNPFSLQSYGIPLRIAGLFSALIGHRIDALDWLSAPFRWLMEVVAFIFCWLAGPTISQQSMSETELDTLFTKCLHQSGPLLARTNGYLKWRFGDEAGFPATVYRIDRKGQLIGFFVTRQFELGGLNHLVLMDFLLDSDTPMFTRLALRLWLIRLAIKVKADTLFTMVNSLNTMAKKFISLPLVRIPDKLLPHATPIFIRAYGHRNKHFESNQSMHITLGDLDYF
jgi:hypothetical protein